MTKDIAARSRSAGVGRRLIGLRSELDIRIPKSALGRRDKLKVWQLQFSRLHASLCAMDDAVEGSTSSIAATLAEGGLLETSHDKLT